MKRKKEEERITYRPDVSLSAGQIIDLVMDVRPSEDFIFDLIVGLEMAVAEGEFLERVCKHFNKELKEQQK